MDIGDVVGGRYELVELLGQGWSGPIYSCKDRETEGEVALRLVRADLAADPDSVSRFLRKAKTAGRIGGAHRVCNLEAGQDAEGRLFIVMEALRGAPLTDALRSRGALEVDEALRIAHQVARALSEAHEAGMPHLCLSPDDVFVEWSGKGTVTAKVLGFGTAGLFRSDDAEPSITHGSAILGVPEYMAPEQARGDAMDEPASDLYALGVILYEMLAGRVPFEASSAFAMLVQHLGALAPSFAERAPEARVPEKVEDLVMQLLEKEPDDRFRSARDLVAELEELLPEP